MALTFRHVQSWKRGALSALSDNFLSLGGDAGAGKLEWMSSTPIGPAYRFTGSATTLERGIHSINNVSGMALFMGGRFYFHGLPTSAQGSICAVSPTDGSTACALRPRVRVNTDGTLQWDRGDGVQGSASSFALEVDTPYLIYWYCENTGASSLNRCWVYKLVSGGTRVELVGTVEMTINQTGGAITGRTHKWGSSGGDGNTSGLQFDMTHFWMAESAGVADDPGPLALRTLEPDGVSADGGWTANGAATIPACLVDVNPVDEDTTYARNSTSTSNHQADLTLEDTGLADADIDAIPVLHACAVSRRTGTTPTFHFGIKSSGAESLVAGVNATAYAAAHHYVHVNPSGGGAWTRAAVEAAMLVLKDADTLNREIRVTNGYIDVVYRVPLAAEAGFQAAWAGLASHLVGGSLA